MKKVIVLIVLAVATFMVDANAQCAMCKATAEQGDQSGLNLGILYLFILPYVIIGTIGYFWWKNRKTKEPSQNDKFIKLSEKKAN